MSEKKYRDMHELEGPPLLGLSPLDNGNGQKDPRGQHASLFTTTSPTGTESGSSSSPNDGSMSSLGSNAPTLASLLKMKDASHYAEEEEEEEEAVEEEEEGSTFAPPPPARSTPSLSVDTIQALEDDHQDVSTVGSFAPTLANHHHTGTATTCTNTDEASTGSDNASETGLGDSGTSTDIDIGTTISSLGSFAPTLVNLQQVKNNHKIKKKTAPEPARVLDSLDDDSVADAVSVVMVPQAPVDQDVNMTMNRNADVHSEVQLDYREDDFPMGDVSTVGSFAPSLRDLDQSYNTHPTRTSSTSTSTVKTGHGTQLQDSQHNQSRQNYHEEDGMGMSSVGMASFTPTWTSHGTRTSTGGRSNQSPSMTLLQRTISAASAIHTSSEGTCAGSSHTIVSTQPKQSVADASVAHYASMSTSQKKNDHSVCSDVSTEAPTVVNNLKDNDNDTAVMLRDTDILVDNQHCHHNSRNYHVYPDAGTAVSSIGMSRAPTLATQQQVRATANDYCNTASPSVVFQDQDIAVPTPPTTPSSTRTTKSVEAKRGSSSSSSRRSKSKQSSHNDHKYHKQSSSLSTRRNKSAELVQARATTPSPSPPRVAARQHQQPRLKPQPECWDNRTGYTIDHDFNHPNITTSGFGLLGGVLGQREPTHTTGLEDVVGSFLKRGAMVGVALWASLLILMVLICPWDSYQYMTVQEQMANATLLILLIGVNMSRLGPLLVIADDDNNKAQNKYDVYYKSFLSSGAMAASVAVQSIAIVSAAMMLLLPTPVLIDPIMGTRCHMVRWCEWTALAFIMCFLTESIDLPLEDADAKHAWFVATMMALSTVCGAIFPFCPNAVTWWIVFVVSCVLFSVIYFRLAWRGWRLRAMTRAYNASALSEQQQDDYQRAKYSFKLMMICSVIWTLLVVSWTACTLAMKYYGDDDKDTSTSSDGAYKSFWTNDWLLLATMNGCEALSKIGYLSILLEVHERLFDDMSQVVQRLEELRSYMSAVWDASTDVVIICSNHDHLVNAAVSPAFYQMEHQQDMGMATTANRGSRNCDHDQNTLVMEVDPYEGSYRTYDMNLSKPMTRGEANDMMKNSRNKARMITPCFEKNLKVLSDLVCDACTLAIPAGQKQYTMRKDFYCVDKYQARQLNKLSCEAKVVKLQSKAFLIMLRNVTEPSSPLQDSPTSSGSVHQKESGMPAEGLPTRRRVKATPPPQPRNAAQSQSVLPAELRSAIQAEVAQQQAKLLSGFQGMLQAALQAPAPAPNVSRPKHA